MLGNIIEIKPLKLDSWDLKKARNQSNFSRQPFTDKHEIFNKLTRATKQF